MRRSSTFDREVAGQAQPGHLRRSGRGRHSWPGAALRRAVRQGDPDWLHFVNTCFDVAMFGHENEIYDAAFEEFFGEKRPLRVTGFPPIVSAPGGSCTTTSTSPPSGATSGGWGGDWCSASSSRRSASPPASSSASTLAVLAHGRGRVVRTLIGAYVEFIRNVPLILLVYLVFYGIPSVGGFAYSATTSFIVTLSLYAGAYLVEVFRAGLDAIPRGLIDAGRAIGLTPWQRALYVRLPTMLRIVLPSLVEHLHLAVQGHLDRLGDRGAGTDLRRAVDQHQHVPHRRGLFRRHADVPGHRLRCCCCCARSNAATRCAAHDGSCSTRCRSCGRGLLVTLQVSAIVVVIALVVRRPARHRR